MSTIRPASASGVQPSAPAEEDASFSLNKECLRSVPFGAGCRHLFSLEDGTVHLNHGSYGAVPAAVLQAQIHYLAKMELNPYSFFRHQLHHLKAAAAKELSEFVGSDPDDIVFVPNATTGVNAVLRSLDLQEGDEVLCLNLAYPAVKNTLRFICYYTQELVDLKVVDIHLPLSSYDDLVNAVLAAISPRTKLAVFDHITSPTALQLPLERLVQTCRERGVPTLVDGAAAPGQLKLDLRKLDVDYYVGDCYKWLYSPKGCAFLYVRKEHQMSIRPVTTGLWYDQGFHDEFHEQGTIDHSASLCVTAALEFYKSLGVDRVGAYVKALLDWAAETLAQMWGTESLLPKWQRCPFMTCVRLPLEMPCLPERTPTGDGSSRDVCEDLILLLYVRYRIMAYIVRIQDSLYVRLSAQIYNVKEDYEKLGRAILQLKQESNLEGLLTSLRESLRMGGA